MKAARILVADDTPASLSLLVDLLEPLGHEVLAVSDGRSAIQLAHKAKPDLVLLDVMMPGSDGFTVCRALKADPETSEIPIIFITSRQETGDIVRGFRVGAVDYILKPFHAEEVITRVNTHLALSRATRELRQRNEELETEISRRQEAEIKQKSAQFNALQARGMIGEEQRLEWVVLQVKQSPPVANLLAFQRLSSIVAGAVADACQWVEFGLCPDAGLRSTRRLHDPRSTSPPR